MDEISRIRALWVSPRLRRGSYRKTSDESERYNCVAWAYGLTDRVDVPGSDDGWWPDGVAGHETLEAFIDSFQQAGCEVCDAVAHEASFEKVAIFGDDMEPTHVARQLPDGAWTSKLGRWEDIEHAELQAVGGGRYGEVRIVMKRSTSGQ